MLSILTVKKYWTYYGYAIGVLTTRYLFNGWAVICHLMTSECEASSQFAGHLQRRVWLECLYHPYTRIVKEDVMK